MIAGLYDISARYAALLDAIEGAESGEEASELLEELAMMNDDLVDKAEQYIRIIKIKEAEAEGFKKEAERLTARRQAAENVAKRLKQAILDAMKLTGQTEIKTSIGKWKVQMNPWSCEVVNIDKVPMEYHIRQEDKIDKKGLLAKFKADGKLIDGVEFRQEQGVRFR